MTSPAAPARALAASAIAAGLIAVAAAGLLPSGAAAVAVLLVAVAAVTTFRTADGSRARARHLRAGTAVLGGTVLGGVVMAGSGSALVSVLVLALCGIAVSVTLRQDGPRDLRVSAMVTGGLVLATAGLAPGAAVAGPLAVAGLLLLAAVVAARDCSPARPPALPMQTEPGRHGWATARRALMPAVVAALVALMVFLLLPRPPSLAEATSRSRLATAARDAAGQQSGDSGRSAAAYSSGTLDMSTRGTLSDDPVLTVPADSPTLWRAGVLDAFDGRRWRASPGPSVPGSDRTGALPVAPGELPALPAGERFDQVEPQGRWYPAVVSPGTPISVVTGSGVPVVGDGTSAAVRGYTSYGVLSSVQLPASAAARAVSDETWESPPAAGRSWTAVPASLPSRVETLAERVAGDAPTVHDAVVAIEDYLRSAMRYSLGSRVPTAGEDAVDAFLFVDRQGFCEQFAAAEVVMLRSLGFSARLATGFSGGAADGDRRVLRDSDAHAWVEVWYPGAGWVASDPTAGSIPLEQAAWWSVLLTWLDRMLSSADGRMRIAAGVLAAVAVSVLGLILVRRRSRRPAAPLPPARRDEPLAALSRLELALAATGAARGSDEGLRRLGGRLSGDELGRALGIAESACYDRAPVPRTSASAAAEVLDRASAALLARHRDEQTTTSGPTTSGPTTSGA